MYENDLKMIAQAREYIQGDVMYNDINLAVYMVRDLQATKDAGLSDLAWSMYKEHGTKSEAIYLLDEIEYFIKYNSPIK